MRSERRHAAALLTCVWALGAALRATPALAGVPSDEARDSARRAVAFIEDEMDAFHDRFPVYDDVSAAGNHFHALGKIPNDTARVTSNGSWTDRPHRGATAIRCEVEPGAPHFGGFYFLNGVLLAGDTAPRLNFGDVANAGVDVGSATALTFWVRGAVGGEQVEFFMGGVGWNGDQAVAPYPDSTRRVSTDPQVTTLTADWMKVSIDLTGVDLSYVLGGFGWVAQSAGTTNPQGAVFFLDDIQYELTESARTERLDRPRFIRSFRTEPVQEQPPPAGSFDRVLRNIAFTYDNALALLAFLAEGSAESLRRARLVGDALVYASEHDRTFDDGRLRDAYAAGDLALPNGWMPNDRAGTVPVPGFYDETEQRFFEIEQQGLSTGNNAWAAIALMALHDRTGATAYLETARRIAAFIRTMRVDAGTYQGFRGGLDHPETAPVPRPWASTEHNLDAYAMFRTLADLTGNADFRDDAEHAGRFVEAMLDASRTCYLTGTIDAETRNDRVGQLPVDAQAWTTLAVPGSHAHRLQVVACADTHHAAADQGFDGYDFNEDRDGVWLEGTAQMAVAKAFVADPGAEAIRETLRRAQRTAPYGDGEGVVAALRDGLTTGFDTPGGTPFLYFRRLHLGATSWLVFGQLGVDPFYLTRGCDDADACTIDPPHDVAGCFPPEPAPTPAAAVACNADNALAVVAHASCSRRCIRTLIGRLERLRDGVEGAPGRGPRRCHRRLASLTRSATRLSDRIERRGEKGRLTPPEVVEELRDALARFVSEIALHEPALCGT